MASADIFYKQDALNLLKHRTIYFFGDSNMRALYKDLVWLLEYGSLIPADCLRRKNEVNFAQDSRLSNGACTNSLSYVEERSYTRNNICLKFQFITRVFQKRFRAAAAEIITYPGLIVMNSCLWDISRYGPSAVAEFKANFTEMLEFVQMNLPNMKMVWLTTLPPSPNCRGGFINAEVRLLQSMLPFNVVQANEFVVKTLKNFNIDVIDLHYYMRFLIDYRVNDGIHWSPQAVRFISNLFLTHLTVSDGLNLPGRVLIGGRYALYDRLGAPMQNGTRRNVPVRNGVRKAPRRNRNRRRNRNNCRFRQCIIQNWDFTKDIFFF